jgi:hypothetical protein
MLEFSQPPVALREVFDVFTKNYAPQADAVHMTGEIAWRNQARCTEVAALQRPSSDSVAEETTPYSGQPFALTPSKCPSRRHRSAHGWAGYDRRPREACSPFRSSSSAGERVFPAAKGVEDTVAFVHS